MYTHTCFFYIYNITTCTNYLTYIFMHTGKTINIFVPNYFGDKKVYKSIPILNKLQILNHPIRNFLIFIFQSLGTWLMIWKYFKHIDNNIILNFHKSSNSQLLFNRLFGTLLAFFFIQFCIIIGFKETAKIPNIFVRNMMCIYQDILFSVIIVDSKTFFSDVISCSLFEIPWFIYFIHHGCKLLPISSELIM